MTCTLTAEQCESLVKLAEGHRAADEYISGTYEQKSGKKWVGGCAIGCTIHDARKLKILPQKTACDDHAALAESTGVPEGIWRLADSIFEGLSDKERAAWPPTLLAAIHPHANYGKVLPQFSIFVLRDCRQNARDDGKAAIDTCIAAWERTLNGEAVSIEEWKEIESAAESAARSAAWSAAESAARSAAESAARSAESAARSAESAARSARSAAFARYRDELLRLMTAAE